MVVVEEGEADIMEVRGMMDTRAVEDLVELWED
jgi:hypothetical protein